MHRNLLNLYQYEGGSQTATRLYDESGNKAREVLYTYGVEGELLSVTGDTPNPFSQQYDAAYRVTNLTDGKGQTTTYSYNTAGLLSQVTYPGGDTIQYTSYDPSGLLLQRIDGNSVVTNYQYNDPGGLLTAITYPAATANNVSYTYDGFGRPSAVADKTGSRAYTYGDADQLLTATTTYTGQSAATLSYTYNPDGSRASMTTPVGAFTYAYDAAGKPTQVTNPFSQSTSWSYLDNDQLASQTTNAPYLKSTYAYNELGQLTGLTNKIASNIVVSSFSGMTYDAAGNRLSVTASNSPFDGTTTYQYDSKDRLVSESSTRGIISGYGYTYAYDAAGNLTTLRGTTSASGSFNLNNQLTGTSMGYDGNGNPTLYGGSSVTFSPENKATVLGTALNADYGAAGMRVWKQSASVSGAAKSYYLYDGAVPVLEWNGSTGDTFVHTFGVSGLVSRLEQTGSSVTGSTYAFDERGNAVQSVDASGSSTTPANLLDAYGATVATPSGSSGGTTGDPYLGFGGQWGYYTDSETGLILCTLRYYDPATGRWLNRDPIGYNGGMNVYGYVNGNPVMLTDPLGLDGVDDLANFFGGWGGGLTYGVTGLLAQNLNRALFGEEYQYNHGGAFIAGTVVGALNQAGIEIAAPLAAGAKTVLYSGIPNGAKVAAEAGKGSGKILAETLGGRFLNWCDVGIRTRQLARGVTDTGFPDWVWKSASFIFAANAKGEIQVYLRGPLRPLCVTNSLPDFEKGQNASKYTWSRHYFNRDKPVRLNVKEHEFLVSRLSKKTFYRNRQTVCHAQCIATWQYMGNSGDANTKGYERSKQISGWCTNNT